MATIQSRKSSLTGKTTYRVQIVRPGYEPVYRSFKKVMDARAFAASEETKINEGTVRVANNARKHTLAAAITKYPRDRPSPPRRPEHKAPLRLLDRAPGPYAAREHHRRYHC